MESEKRIWDFTNPRRWSKHDLILWRRYKPRKCEVWKYVFSGFQWYLTAHTHEMIAIWQVHEILSEILLNRGKSIDITNRIIKWKCTAWVYSLTALIQLTIMNQSNIVVADIENHHQEILRKKPWSMRKLKLYKRLKIGSTF